MRPAQLPQIERAGLTGRNARKPKRKPGEDKAERRIWLHCGVTRYHAGQGRNVQKPAKEHGETDHNGQERSNPLPPDTPENWVRYHGRKLDPARRRGIFRKCEDGIWAKGRTRSITRPSRFV